NFIGNALAGSEIARPQLPLPTGRPRPTTDVSNRFDPGYAGHAQAGSDGWSLTDYDLVGSAVAGTGLFALNQVERFDLLYLPPPCRAPPARGGVRAAAARGRGRSGAGGGRGAARGARGGRAPAGGCAWGAARGGGLGAARPVWLPQASGPAGARQHA